MNSHAAFLKWARKQPGWSEWTDHETGTEHAGWREHQIGPENAYKAGWGDGWACAYQQRRDEVDSLEGSLTRIREAVDE